MSQQSILVIEDERSILDALVYNLQKDGFDVITATDGQDGLRRAQASLPDLIVLDLMLPVTDGLEVCRQLRADPRTKHIRILMLTAKSEEVDEIVGFSMGADDYVTKPFKVKPLISRVKALLRRPSAKSNSQDIVTCRGISVDRMNHRVTLNNEEVLLTPTEFKLLWTLVRQSGRPFRRNELMDTCRGEDANALERTIDVHIRSLRQKLDDHADLIETVRGVGYRFRPE
ncbi:MAG: response regulator [Rubinisphaera brasiliensis]|uniref:Two component transcriptional regulator, winged helix family n=1 Tax=Rubinisphaera brasiliensis (strain ATCC 49424 / DSM 5305 / JCM 21570 / IAM 15109 / NBRC 103401 / IFAM 1448) TaxID=756272 RepID=F0SNU4_RUBBR|nr:MULTISPECIES: response regulator [Rubinisphaera]ADY60020.1 two component transcriptional regulator, winged helix family [Rubinisphaera brasiliensis DSM 5305]MBR9802728.1 response regulator [bacterium]